MKRAPLQEHVAVRIEPELVARIDALAQKVSEPWREASRSDALRLAILTGLEVLEAKVKAGEPIADVAPVSARRPVKQKL